MKMILHKKCKNDTLNAEIFYNFNKIKLTCGYYLYSETRKISLNLYKVLNNISIYHQWSSTFFKSKRFICKSFLVLLSTNIYVLDLVIISNKKIQII